MVINYEERGIKITAENPPKSCLECPFCLDDITGTGMETEWKHACFFTNRKLEKADFGIDKTCPTEFPRAEKTNADRIRSMSDEELAEWLTNMTDDFGEDEELYKSIYNLDTEKVEDIHDSYGDLLNWLQSPVDEVSDMENLEARR